MDEGGRSWLGGGGVGFVFFGGRGRVGVGDVGDCVVGGEGMGGGVDGLLWDCGGVG